MSVTEILWLAFGVPFCAVVGFACGLLAAALIGVDFSRQRNDDGGES